MNIFDIDNIAFTLGGAGVSWLELISVAAGLGCVVLAGRNSKFNFWVGYLYNILLFVMFWQRHLYSAMLLQPIAFGINAFGQWRWSHPKSGEASARDAGSLKVSHLKPGHWGWAVLFVLGAGLIWGFVLSLLGLIRPDADPAGAIPLRPEEVGLLAGLACGECMEHLALRFGWACVHADCVRPVSHKWGVVVDHLV